MSISGKVINGVLHVRHKGTFYPLIASNARAVEAYMHTGEKAYLLALATEKELQQYGNPTTNY